MKIGLLDYQSIFYSFLEQGENVKALALLFKILFLAHGDIAGQYCNYKFSYFQAKSSFLKTAHTLSFSVIYFSK